MKRYFVVLWTLTLVFGMVGMAGATTIIAGYEFDDNAFADAIYAQLGVYGLYGASTLEDCVTGDDVNSYAWAISSPAYLGVEFTDNVLVNDEGYDLALFETGPTLDTFGVRLEGQGPGNWQWYTPTDTGYKDALGFQINVALIDLDDFGLADGSEISRIEIKMYYYQGSIPRTPRLSVVGAPVSVPQAPIVNAGPDLTILIQDQDSTVLQGAASDPNNDPLTYRWLEGEDELLGWRDVGDTGEANLDLSAIPYFSAGDHTLKLEVTDGEFTSSDEMVLTVEGPPDPCADLGGDTDGDGECDDLDNCPNIVNPDQIDTDGDGFGDACDNCPSDPNKTEPGICGCGVADTDSDGDGIADCNDGCPNDPNKISPGICGCGVADTDSDGDGIADCNDNCPSDPNKTEPGICGCGVADTDSDGDGTADCNDGCPNDPNKISPGICGCGVADTDSDGDGIADCNDNCPSDPNKTEPGICGCGVADTDSDGDGTADCNDGCPNDPNKISPGICGCGVADTDSDGDGIADCNDNCPSDPNKTEPGICGCGVADTDSDEDGVPDCYDNCPNTSNPSQEDTDGDGIGDACEPPPGKIDSLEVTNWRGEPQLEFEATEPILVTVRYTITDAIRTYFDNEEQGIDVEFPVKAKIILKIGTELFVTERLFRTPGTDHYIGSPIASSCGYGTRKVVAWLKILKGGNLLQKYTSDVQYVTINP